jgi:hypothetical protein
MACVSLFRVSATIFLLNAGLRARLYRSPDRRVNKVPAALPAASRTFDYHDVAKSVELWARESSTVGFDKPLPEMIHENVETPIAGEYLRYVYRYLDAVARSHQRQVRSLQRDHEA